MRDAVDDFLGKGLRGKFPSDDLELSVDGRSEHYSADWVGQA